MQPAPVELVVDLRCDVSKPADLLPAPPAAPTDAGAAADGADSTRDAQADAGASQDDGAATAVSAPTRTEQESASAQQSDDAAGCAIQQPPARRALLDGVWWLLLGALLHRARRGAGARR